jgi:MoaA/NifB/PqqE/SkfB family radical SAM enzyme
MSSDLWGKILKELAQSGNHHTLITHGAGEPLLYPRLFELLAAAKALPNLTVGFMTNVMLLTPDVSREIMRLGVDWLAFSVDGVEPESHARYRRGSDLNVIEKHLSYLIHLKKKQGENTPVLSFNMKASNCGQTSNFPVSVSKHFSPDGGRLEWRGRPVLRGYPCRGKIRQPGKTDTGRDLER